MSTTKPVAIPDWLVPGAEIVVYTKRNGVARDPRPGRIKSVAKKTFRVDGFDLPFLVDTLETRGAGTVWSSRSDAVTSTDSDLADQLRKKDHERQTVQRARHAVGEWRRQSTRENAIQALQALQALQAIDDGAGES